MSQLNKAAVDKLFGIQKNNRPQLAKMPFAEEYIEVDWRSREIGERSILSTARDHKAENIYFIMDRYWDFMDLATCTCVITYKTYPVDPEKTGVTGLYAVPYYDIYSHRATPGTFEKDRMVIPWCIDGRVTQDEAEVEYAIRFYRIDNNGEKVLYNINTMPSVSKVLYGLNVQPSGMEDAGDLAGDYDISPKMYETLIQEIGKLQRQDIFWIEFL
jgi:hypothetical protein